MSACEQMDARLEQYNTTNAPNEADFHEKPSVTAKSSSHVPSTSDADTLCESPSAELRQWRFVGDLEAAKEERMNRHDLQDQSGDVRVLRYVGVLCGPTSPAR